MHSLFIELLQVALGTRDMLSRAPSAAEWCTISALAQRHGLTGLLTDGINKLKDNQRPEKELLLTWIGETLQKYEYRYELYCRAIAELAGFYNAHHFKMMILKGYACGLAWPKPEHRPCGDIDIWLFGNQKLADEVIERESSIKVDTSEHRHTVFKWRGFLVENHYDFLNVYHHRSNMRLEQLLKQLGKNDSYFVDILGERVYLPSPDLHALFILKHSMSHFAAEGLNLRQLLDWAFFVQANGQFVNWEVLKDRLDQYGMLELFYIFNAICIDDLGFNASLFPGKKVNLQLKQRVLNELLSPEFKETMPPGLLRRVLWKIRRWKANGWKHELCYKESRWNSFCWGIWAHLLKPKTI